MEPALWGADPEHPAVEGKASCEKEMCLDHKGVRRGGIQRELGLL